ncbi:hypothetical protein [Halocynthiibacter styelae]|uniref:hypothetical protein n=1 Tax=Halocynthiibacter styelae TaxID=2761955 RepID=UPI001E4BB09C|nr:hypothetical protein [Paenihalocynthiibacter styelae]
MFRHAVNTAEIAAVCYGQAQVIHPALEGIDQEVAGCIWLCHGSYVSTQGRGGKFNHDAETAITDN